MTQVTPQPWWEISAEQAMDLNLMTHTDIDAPLNEDGERCPWPWYPQQIDRPTIGQLHCIYCGAMCLAGFPHPDYRTMPDPGHHEDAQ
jgi:hypothetical protein